MFYATINVSTYPQMMLNDYSGVKDQTLTSKLYDERLFFFILLLLVIIVTIFVTFRD